MSDFDSAAEPPCTCHPTWRRIPHRDSCPRFSSDRAASIADRGRQQAALVAAIDQESAAALDGVMQIVERLDRPGIDRQELASMVAAHLEGTSLGRRALAAAVALLALRLRDVSRAVAS